MRITLIGKIAGDALIVNAAYIAAFLIRFGGDVPRPNLEAYIAAAPWVTCVALLLFYSYGLYSPQGSHRWDEVFSAVVVSVVLISLSAIALSYLMRLFAFPRLVFLISIPLQMAAMLLWRRFVWSWSTTRMGSMHLLIIGTSESAKRRAEQITLSVGHPYRVAGMVVDVPETPRHGEESGFPMFGPFSELACAADSVSAHGVLFCQDVPAETKMALIPEALSRGLSVFVIPEIYDILLSTSHFDHLDGIPVFRLRPPKLEHKLGSVVDFVLASMLIIPAMPLLLAAGLALKIESPHSPVIFSQDRVGQGGRVFKLHKLRTMVDDAEEETGPILSHGSDPRVTRVGSVLRMTRIDELPQLVNVIRGDMSLIGPRPERPYFVDQFRGTVRGYDYRHQIKTGITGLAQINGKYSTSAEDKLRFDVFYARTKSLTKDLQILMQTLQVMMIRSKSM